MRVRSWDFELGTKKGRRDGHHLLVTNDIYVDMDRIALKQHNIFSTMRVGVSKSHYEIWQSAWQQEWKPAYTTRAAAMVTAMATAIAWRI